MRFRLATVRCHPSSAAFCMGSFILVSLIVSGCVERDDVEAPAPIAQAALAKPPFQLPPPPTSEIAPKAEALPPPETSALPAAQSEDKLGLAGRTSVAMLLPLSGPNAAIATDMQDAALLAIEELAGPSLAVTVKDTLGTPDGAAEAARQAVAEGAKLIIGPLTAAEAQAVKPIASAGQINVVCFSNVARIAGDGLFVMGFLPQQEVKRVVDYAHSTGINHFAVIAPSDAYGQLAADAYQAAIVADGATVDPPELYQPGLSDLPDVIKHLSADGQFTFAAVLIPSGGAALKQVAAQLSGAGVTLPKVRLLGTGLWDNGNLSSEPTLVGGWYAAVPKRARTQFEQRFDAAYGHPPQRLATLAYDAVALSAVLARSNGGDFSTTALTNESGFAGADGLFRLKSDGTNERGLAVLEIEQSGTSVISPAPESFQTVGQ